MSAFLLPLWFASIFRPRRVSRVIGSWLFPPANSTYRRFRPRFLHFSLKNLLSETPSIAVEKGIPNPSGRYSQRIFMCNFDYRNIRGILENKAAQHLVHRWNKVVPHHNIYPAPKVSLL
jgi:hypothetical protein